MPNHDDEIAYLQMTPPASSPEEGPMTTPQFKIEKNVPAPPARGKYPFREMEVGDSFFAPGEVRHRVDSAASYAAARLNRTFRTAKVDGGIRVWRIA